jgi:hypothetical protein
MDLGTVEATSVYDEDGKVIGVTYWWTPADAKIAHITREAFDQLASDAGWVERHE